MIRCDEAVRQLWEYLDGAVDDAQRDAIEEHLNLCRRCCGEAEFADELRQFLATHGEDEPSSEAHARLLQALDEVIDGR